MQKALDMIRGKGLSGWLALAGSLVLFAMMMLTTVDVVRRYFFNNPITGALEISEYMVALVVFCFLGITQREKGHVAVDLVVAYLPSGTRRLIEAAVQFISLVLLAFMTWRTVVYGLETMEMGEYSSILQIPKAPFVFAVALGCLSMGLEMARDFLDTCRGKGDQS